MIRRGAAAIALLTASSACAGASRDVVPESRDVHGAVAPALTPEGYVYVAKRSHGIVALAEARGLSDDVAREATNRIADALDACAAHLAAEGKLARDGAGRVVAAIEPDGSVGGLNVKAATGAYVATNLLMCVVSPLRIASFPAVDAGARGIALEATWGMTP